MTNKVRGETAIDVPGVGKVTLCLTLAGMAHLEDAFGVESMEDAMSKVGESPSSKHLATVLYALTLGGSLEFTEEEIRHWPITPAAIRDAITAMNASNADAAGNVSDVPANRQTRRASARKA